MPSGSASQIRAATSASSAGRKDELCRLPQPAQRRRSQGRWNEPAPVTQRRRHWLAQPQRNLLPMSHRPTRTLCLRARSSARGLSELSLTARLGQSADAYGTKRDALFEVSLSTADDRRPNFYRGFRPHCPAAAGNLLVGRLSRSRPWFAGEWTSQVLRQCLTSS